MTACIHPGASLRFDGVWAAAFDPDNDGKPGCATCMACGTSLNIEVRQDALERLRNVGEVVAGHDATLHRAAPERAHISPQSVRSR